MEPFVLKHGITYPVGIARSHESFGSGGIPHAYLISPDGEVAWHGHPASLSDGDIEKLLRKTKDFWIRDLADQLRAAGSAFEKGRLSEAERLAEEIRASATEDGVIADAKHVIERVQALVAYWRKRVESSVEAGLYEDALDALDALQKHYDDTQAAAKAAATEKALKSDPAVKKEIRLSKQLARYKEDLRDAGNSDRKREALAKRVQSFIEKNEGTKAAKRAEALLAAIQNG